MSFSHNIVILIITYFYTPYKLLLINTTYFGKQISQYTSLTLFPCIYRNTNLEKGLLYETVLQQNGK